MKLSASQSSRESDDSEDIQADDGLGMPDSVKIFFKGNQLLELTRYEILQNEESNLSRFILKKESGDATSNGYIAQHQGNKEMRVTKTDNGYSVEGVTKALLVHILKKIFKPNENTKRPPRCSESDFQQAYRLLKGSSDNSLYDSPSKSDLDASHDSTLSSYTHISETKTSRASPSHQTDSAREPSAREPSAREPSAREPISSPDLSESRRNLSSYVDDITYWVMAAIAVVIAIALLWLYLSDNKLPVKSAGPVCMKSDNPGNVIRERLESNLPYQHHMFWTHLKLSVRSAARDERPACLIIALNSSEPTESRSSVQCVAKHSACALSGRQQVKYIEGFGRQGSHHYSDIDDELSKHFGGGNRVAVIHDIDLFDLKTAMLFYRYCDDNADPAYPSTLLLLTLSHTDPRTVSDSWITQRLTQQWSSDPDELDPILSRITGSITSINSTNMQSNMCHV